jgi:hypothetical protein
VSDILDWITEQLGDTTQEGQLSLVGLLHFRAGGEEVEIHSMKVGAPKWGNAEVMASVLDGIATRHARGIPGAQQFQLVATFGGSGKPTRFLPFTKAGKLEFGAIPGGLATEAPSDVGARQQGMRLIEIIAQGSFSQNQHNAQTQAVIIDRLMKRQAELEGENRELFVALRDQLIEFMKLDHERRMKELEYTRSTEERRKLLQLLPALANAISGREVFPATAEDSAIVETLADNISEDELKMLAQVLGQKSPELAGLIMTRFAAIQKKKKEQAEEVAKLSKQATGRIDPELDAAGDATTVDKMKQLGGGAKK